MVTSPKDKQKKVVYLQTTDTYYRNDGEKVSGKRWEFLRHTVPHALIEEAPLLYFAHCLDFIGIL